jgi:hypothetical protein
MFSFPGAVVLLSLGIWLLAGLSRAFQRTQILYQMVERTWQEAQTLFERRTERLTLLLKEARALSVLQSPVDELTAVFRTRQASVDREQWVVCEQEISRQIAILAAQAESCGLDSAGSHKELCDLIIELQEQEPILLAAREHYNAVATAWNTYRRRFPANLIADARDWAVFPLFYPPDHPESLREEP